jgi:hypothetical protein
MFDYSSSIKNRTVVCDKDRFETVVNSTLVQQICSKIAQWHKKKEEGRCSQKDFDRIKTDEKKKLPVFLFHAHFKDGHRINSMAEPSGICIYDLDHISDPEKEWKKIAGKADKLGILLAHLTPSTEGLRLVFAVPKEIYKEKDVLYKPGAELALAQKWMSEKLGETTYDTSVKDYARCSFAVPKSYIYYLNDDLFTYKTPIIEEAQSDNQSKVEEPVKKEEAKLVRQGVNTPSEESQKLFRECVKAANLTMEDFSNVGIRHNSLVSLLSIGTCRLMKKDQLIACLNNVAPEYSMEHDCRQLIDDWYVKYNDTNRPMSRRLQRIFTNSLKGFKSDTQTEHDPVSEKINLDIDAMPRAIRDSLITTPEYLRLPVLISLLPLMAAYADGVEFDYLDNQTTRLNMMSFVIGPQASGKSACTRMQNIWLKPMLEQDEQSRKAEDEWKEKDRTLGANEERPPKPHLPIRCCSATISNRMFHTRLVNAAPHTVYMFCPELDTMVNSNSQGQWANLYDKMRMSDDNDLWNMDYSNSESLSKLVRVRCNYSMLGTYGAFQRCFKESNVENGLATRVLIAEMPDSSFQPLVPYQKISTVQIKNIMDGIHTLSQAQGHMEFPRLRELIADWADEKMSESIDRNDYVVDTFRRRTARIGMRIGVILSILEGQETDRVLKLTRQLTDYILNEQILIFGNQVAKIHDENSIEYYKLKNKDLLNRLPHQFSMKDLACLKPGATSNAIRIIISRWIKGGKIKKEKDNCWIKI